MVLLLRIAAFASGAVTALLVGGVCQYIFWHEPGSELISVLLWRPGLWLLYGLIGLASAEHFFRLFYGIAVRPRDSSD